MFPSYNGQYSMDTPLYQQLQLSPPSPKPDQPFYYPYGPCPSPPFAADEGFHLGAATAGMIDTLPTPRTEQAPSKAVGSERAGRKDRHSKICTAGGMRDRRMRLSLDVARRFFALQDTLGFDKASKTVHWLLEMSKVAIKELVSSSSECEDGSSLSDDKHKPAEAEKKPKARRATTQKTARKGVPHAATDKESRAKARERARERTREKHRLRWATLASSIAVEAPSSRDLHSSSSQNNEGWHDMAMAGEPIHGAIPALEYGSCSHQQQWELGGVVFNSHFY